MIPLPFETKINTQPVEKQDLDPDGVLDVVDIFPTIQGEGPFAGEPAVFVRLAGCNLSESCLLCDTNYTAGREKRSIEDICQRIGTVIPKGTSLIVLTGGEPFRQNILPLLHTVLSQEFSVQIETNGTLYLDGLEELDRVVWQGYYPGDFTIVCSPKTGKVNEKLRPFIHSLKYVVTAEKVDPLDGLPTDSLGAGVRVQRPWDGFKGTVYVQPADEGDPVKNKANLEEAVKSCLNHGYRLSIQLHKIASLP